VLNLSTRLPFVGPAVGISPLACVAHALNRRARVTDSSAITVWLAVIGIASALQVLLVLGAIVAGVIAYRRTTRAVDDLRREALDPVLQRVNTVLDDFHDVAGRVQAADDQVRSAVTQTARGVGHAAAVVGARFWPVVGVARGAWAAFNALRDRYRPGPVGARGPRAIRPI